MIKTVVHGGCSDSLSIGVPLHVNSEAPETDRNPDEGSNKPT